MLHDARHGKQHLRCSFAWHEDWQVRLEVLQLGRVVVSKQTNKQTKQTSMSAACKCLPAQAEAAELDSKAEEEVAGPGVQLTFELIIKPAICM